MSSMIFKSLSPAGSVAVKEPSLFAWMTCAEEPATAFMATVTTFAPSVSGAARYDT